MVLEDYGELMFLQTVLRKLGFDVDAIQNPRMLADSLLRMNPDVLLMTAYGKRVRGVDLCKNVRRARGIPRVVLLRTPGAAPVPDPDLPVEGWLDSPVTAMSFLNILADLCGLNKQALTEKFQKLHLKDTAEEFDRTLKVNSQTEPEMGRAIAGGNFTEEEPPQTQIIKGTRPEKPKTVIGSVGGKAGAGPTAPDSKAATDVDLVEGGTFVGSPEAGEVLERSNSGNLQPSTLTAEDRNTRYAKALKEQAPKETGFGAKAVAEQVRDLRKNEKPDALADLEAQRRAFVEHLFKKKA